MDPIKHQAPMPPIEFLNREWTPVNANANQSLAGIGQVHTREFIRG